MTFNNKWIPIGDNRIDEIYRKKAELVIAKMMTKNNDNMMRQAWGLNHSTTTTGEPEPEMLTAEMVQDLIKEMTTTLYYTTTDAQEEGKILVVEARQGSVIDCPKYYIMHPDDFEQFKAQTPPMVEWIHLRDYKGVSG